MDGKSFGDVCPPLGNYRWAKAEISPKKGHFGHPKGFVVTLLVAALQVVQGMGLCPWVALSSPKSLSATLEKQQKGLGKEEE